MRPLVLFILVSCSSSSSAPDASTASSAFEYNATARWSAQATPEVTSVMIDGRALSIGQTFTVDQVFASYADASAMFTPHPVVVVTMTQTLTFQLDMLRWPCANLSIGPIAKQADRFSVVAGLQGSDAIGFDAYSGTCESS